MDVASDALEVEGSYYLIRLGQLYQPLTYIRSAYNWGLGTVMSKLWPPLTIKCILSPMPNAQLRLKKNTVPSKNPVPWHQRLYPDKKELVGSVKHLR